MMSADHTITTPGLDVGQVLAVADEIKRSLRPRISGILDIGAKDVAAETARAAVTVFRELDDQTRLLAAFAFLVLLAADDARFRRGAAIGQATRKRKSDASAGGRQNLRKSMPRETRYAGESFPAHCIEARYQEQMARQRAEQGKKEPLGDA